MRHFVNTPGVDNETHIIVKVKGVDVEKILVPYYNIHCFKSFVVVSSNYAAPCHATTTTTTTVDDVDIGAHGASQDYFLERGDASEGRRY